MQLVNKYNPLFTIILVIVLSSSLLCIDYCEAGDTKTDVCSKSVFSNPSIKEKCYELLGSEENTCPPNNTRCPGIFVNTKATNATIDLIAVATNASRASELARGGGGHKQSPVQSCLSYFNHTINSLKQCNSLWNNRRWWNKDNKTSSWNKNSLNMYASAAQTSLNNCDDEFKGKPNYITVASGQVQSLISVELAIINMLPVT